MNVKLSKKELLDRVLAAVDASGWQALVVDNLYPFGLRLFRREDPQFISLRIYIWNCTPGGKNRPADEFRVQRTRVLNVEKQETTLLLGWHEGYGVFAGFDIHRHTGKTSKSPSIQVKEWALLAAHNSAFSAYDRELGEIAVCFRPEFFAEYVMNLKTLHGFTPADDEELRMLNALASVSEQDIDTQITDHKRREVITSIKRKYREYDFRDRVLAAYRATCAFCGVQLKLVDAAHIIPVAADSSTDETRNGLALCVLHHRAYDQNLLSFDDTYRIQVSAAAIAQLGELGLVGGLGAFRKGLKSAIVLPADTRDYPDRGYIAESRKVRQWQG